MTIQNNNSSSILCKYIDQEVCCGCNITSPHLMMYIKVSYCIKAKYYSNIKLPSMI